MVQNFEFKDGYGVLKLRPHVGRSKMTNWLHASPVVEESMSKISALKSVFTESSTFSKTIFNFLVRFPIVLISHQIRVCTAGAHEITGDITRKLKIFL